MEKTIEKIDIRSLNYKELQEEMTRIGEKAFRGKQIYEWLHVKLADSFQEMTNLSRSLREKLEAQYVIRKVDMLEHQISKKDPTEKFLFELEDGNVVESVLMKYNYGNSVCISSQVGCRMGCKFCASTIGWKGTKPDYIRDAGTGVPNSENQRRAGIQYRSHGNRRAIR